MRYRHDAVPMGSDGFSGGLTLSSSGMVAQYVFSTCFRAGRLIGFAKKKFIPQAMPAG